MIVIMLTIILIRDEASNPASHAAAVSSASVALSQISSSARSDAVFVVGTGSSNALYKCDFCLKRMPMSEAADHSQCCILRKVQCR